MAEPTESTLKKLHALSGNICAFPGCAAPIVSLSGTLTGEIFHICARNSKGPRFRTDQSDKERHALGNLMLLCGDHHKIIDTECKIYDEEVLKEIKAIHEATAGRPESKLDAVHAKMLLNAYRMNIIESNTGNIAINSPGVIQGNVIHLNTLQRKVQIAPPSGTIGSDASASRYCQHLIKRYNEFASKDTRGKTTFSFGVNSRNISTQFGTEWKLIPLARASEVFKYLQNRIDRKTLAKINRSNGYPAYSSLEEFKVKYGNGDA